MSTTNSREKIFDPRHFFITLKKKLNVLQASQKCTFLSCVHVIRNDLSHNCKVCLINSSLIGRGYARILTESVTIGIFATKRVRDALVNIHKELSAALLEFNKKILEVSKNRIRFRKHQIPIQNNKGVILQIHRWKENVI